MSRLITDDVEEYVDAHSEPPTELFAELRRDTLENTEYPTMQSGQVEGLFLRTLVATLQAKLVVEIGTFTGYAALMMAEGIPEGGKLIACDISEEFTAMARRYWAKSPHGAKIDLRIAPALETLATINDPIDFVFIDADKESYPAYFDACVPKVRQGGIIATDNVLRNGNVLNPQTEQEIIINEFNKQVLNDPRVETVMLTVRDGITLAHKL